MNYNTHTAYPSRRIGTLLSAVIFSFATLMAGCNSGQSTSRTEIKDTLTVKPDANAEPASFVLQAKTLQYQLTLPGELRAFESVTLYAKVIGFVKKRYADRGDHVHKGQLLAELEAPEITQQYLAAVARQQEVRQKLQNSLQQYNRINLAAQTPGAISPVSVDDAHSRLLSDSAAYNASTAAVRAAQAMRAYTSIRSPFDGIIAQTAISDGALVGKGEQPLFTIFQGSKLRLEVAIPAEHAENIDPEATSYFTLESRPGESYPARLSRSSQILDNLSKTLTLEFDIDNNKLRADAGTMVQMTIHLKKKQPSIRVPQTSILNEKGGQFLLKKVNQAYKKIPVTIGLNYNDSTEVFGAISAADSILLDGSQSLR